jgi:signal recognition particle subunit SRP54
LGIDGVILTKLDGDTRGGAALSVRAVTGKPIKFVGTGERLDQLEPFYPDRWRPEYWAWATVMTLIEKAQSSVDEKKARQLEQKLKKNAFTLTDLLDQIETATGYGPSGSDSWNASGSLRSTTRNPKGEKKSLKK